MAPSYLLVVLTVQGAHRVLFLIAPRDRGRRIDELSRTTRRQIVVSKQQRGAG
jgi:hypothetical protein